MARIRTIKPEILEDQKTADLTHEAWRLFVSLIVLADDFGAMRGDSAWLHGQIFWATPVSGGPDGMAAALAELQGEELIEIYEVRGQRYLQVVNWEKHQRVDNRGKPRVPRPDDQEAWAVKPTGRDFVYFIQATKSKAIKIGYSWDPPRRLQAIQAGHPEKLELLLQVPGTRVEEHALHRQFGSLRLAGEWFRWDASLCEYIDGLREGLATLSRESIESLASDQGSGIREGTTKGRGRGERRGSAATQPSRFEGFSDSEIATARVVLERLGSRNGVRYQLSRPHLKLIATHLRAGISEFDLRAIVGYCAVELRWATDDKMHKYLRPETLFGPETIARYLDPARTWANSLPEGKPAPTLTVVATEAS